MIIVNALSWTIGKNEIAYCTYVKNGENNNLLKYEYIDQVLALWSIAHHVYIWYDNKGANIFYINYIYYYSYVFAHGMPPIAVVYLWL